MAISLLLFGLCGLLGFGVLIAVLVIWAQNRQVGEQTPDLPEPAYPRGRASLPADLEAQVRQLMEAGNKIEAIKIYRQATGVGLKEAKDAVEAAERGQRLLERTDAAWKTAATAQPATPAQLEAEIRELVEKDNKLAAIALYRSATQSDLKEAKDAVEALALGEPLILPELGTVASNASDTPNDLENQVVNLLRKGNKIEAIKLYRQATDVELVEAKEIVEAIERRRL